MIWMSIKPACEDAFTARIADTPDGGPAVALWENDTLHKCLKQTWQAEWLNSSVIWMSQRPLRTIKGHFLENADVFVEKSAVMFTFCIISTDGKVADGGPVWPDLDKEQWDQMSVSAQSDNIQCVCIWFWFICSGLSLLRSHIWGYGQKVVCW